MESEQNSTLHLLPTGEGEIVKKTKFGIYVKFKGQKPIFIYFSETFTDPDTWEKRDDKGLSKVP